MKILIPIFCFSIIMLFTACEHHKTPIKKSRVKTMLIKSSGEITVQPDEASITINLSCTNKDIKKSKNCLIDKSEALNTLVTGFGIDQKDILTASINQSKEYKWINNSSVFVGYKSSMTTFLTIRNLETLEDLYTELLLNKNISIGYLTYSHSKLDSLNLIAYQNALENANTLADKLLDKMDETKKEIIRIGNMNLPATQAEYEEDKLDYEVMAESNVAKRKIRINNGTMSAYQSLVVEYKIN